MIKLIKFHKTLYTSDFLTFAKAKAIQPSITVAEYEKLTGNKVKEEAPKKETPKKVVK